MRTKEIIKRAEALKLPIAENEFIKTKENPLPEPPYLIWYEDEVNAKGGDEVVLFKTRKIVLELYTDKVGDNELEKQIENSVLYDIKYNKFQAPIEGEDLVQTAYEFYVTEKIPKGERRYG